MTGDALPVLDEPKAGRLTIQYAPVAETALIQRLATALVEALSIPASSQDHVISGEGTVRKRDRLIEVEYEWDKTKPYAWPSEAGGGTITLVALEDR